MKRLFFDWIWQWYGGDYIAINPIGIEVEYIKVEPSISIMVVVLGVGFSITWLVPWETKESKEVEEINKDVEAYLDETNEV